MYCRNCGAGVADQAIACPSCGVPPLVEHKFCWNCGAQTAGNQVMCTACGVGLASIQQPGPLAVVPGGKNKATAGILGILMGGLGIHKFYLGYSTAGLVMLLVTVLTLGFGALVMGPIGLIEGIIYLTKSDDEFYREYVVGERQWF